MSGTPGFNRFFRAVLIASTAMMAPGGIAIAQAQSTAQAGAVSFNIPSQSLTASLTAFARQTGIRIAYPAALTSGKSAPALRGSFTSAEALGHILAGSGLSYRFTGDRAVTIIDPSAADSGSVNASGALVLQTIDVHGSSETGWGPVGGLVAQTSATGTKTDTPLLDVPASVSVIGETEIEKRGVKNLDQALNYTSGVNTNLYGADKRYDFLAIRGFDETGMGIYRDGLQNRTYNFTGSRVEPYGMQRVEVMKGSTSTLYGLNSPGGLVNMITKRPQDQKHGEIYTTFGEDHIETGTDFGGPIDANGDWSYRITAKWQDSKDGHDWARDDRLYIAPALTWKPTDYTTLTLLADYNKRKGANRYGIPLGSGLDPDTFLGEKQFDQNDTKEWNIGYVFDHDFGNGLKFHSNARYNELDLSNKNTYASSAHPVTSRRYAMMVEGELERFSMDNHLQYDASFGRFDSRTLFGVDYSRTKQNESDTRGRIAGVGDLYNPIYCSPNCVLTPDLLMLGPPYTGSGTQTAAGVYLQEELTLDDRWILTLGTRYDRVDSKADADFDLSGLLLSDSQDIKEHALTSRAGLTFKATEELSVYGTYSESFQPVPPVPSFYGAFGLPSLSGDNKPVEGVMWEAGVKYRPTGMNALFTAAVFSLEQENAPYYVGLQRYQIGKLRTKGLELEAKAAINERLNLTLAYSYLDSEILEDGLSAVQTNKGNRFQFIPAQTASAWVDYTIPGNDTFGDLTLGLGARFVGTRYADNANTLKLSSYTVFDAALNYQIADNASLAVNVTNLFDKKYISHVETWSAPDTLFYGDRRSIKGTLKYTW